MNSGCRLESSDTARQVATETSAFQNGPTIPFYKCSGIGSGSLLRRHKNGFIRLFRTLKQMTLYIAIVPSIRL